MAEGKKGQSLIAFESGHYKNVTGSWKGDSVWAHFKKDSGGGIHVNKDKVEYIETFEEAGTVEIPVEKTVDVNLNIQYPPGADKKRSHHKKS